MKKRMLDIVEIKAAKYLKFFIEDIYILLKYSNR